MNGSFSQKKGWAPWVFVGLWTVVIYSTLPFVRSIQSFAAEHWGRQVFTGIVLSSVTMATGFMVLYVIRLRRPRSWKRLIWLFGVAGIWVYCTIQLKTSPEEALHLLEYGVLGFLLFRALSYRLRDSLIYLSAFLLAVIIGTIDEVIQWITPRRFWGLRDVGLNALSSGLMQLAIAMGLRPPFISGRIPPVSIRLVCRITIMLLVLLGFCFSNTPQFIMWYAERVPGLSFLKESDSVMTEYGYCHEDPIVGRFYSRLSLDELKHEDLDRGVAAADIIDRYQSREKYSDFLKIYTPLTDPFVHEARVHLFRRDYHVREMGKHSDDEKKQRFHCTIVYQENQILNTYFHHTLSNSNYMLSAREISFALNRFDKNLVSHSWVSRDLITRFTEKQIQVIILILLLTALAVDLYYGTRSYTAGV